MAYQKPQAIIHQQFETIPSITEDELRAVIVGPSAILHRYADSDEKIDIFLGLYNPADDVTYLYPGRSAGGIVDKSYSKLYVDNALLSYFLSTDHKRQEDLYAVRATTTIGTAVTDLYVRAESFSVSTPAYNSTNVAADATKGASGGTPLQVYKYERINDGLKYYKAPVTGDTEFTFTNDPTDSGIAKYGTGTYSYIHRYVAYTNAINEPVYVAADGISLTTVSSEAKVIEENASIPLYIISTDSEDYLYKFYGDYDNENVIRCDTNTGALFNFKESADTDRNINLGMRDVQIGDYALVWATYKNDGKCIEAGPQLSRITGFTSLETTASISDITIDQPKACAALARTFKQTIGTATPTGGDIISTPANKALSLATYASSSVLSNIDPFRSGLYSLDGGGAKELRSTITVTTSKYVESGNCEGVVYATVTNTATDEVRTIQIVEGSQYLWEEYGADTISFTATQVALIAAQVQQNVVIKWEYSISSAYTPLTYNATTKDIEILGLADYTGSNDVYILTVTEGSPASSTTVGPTAFVTTAYGTENQSTVITSTAWSTGVPLGTKGLIIKFKNTNGAAQGLPAGFKLNIDVTASKVIAYDGIQLADNLINTLRPTSSSSSDRKYINLRLLYRNDIELPAISPVNGDYNWKQEYTNIIICENASTVSSEFININGTYIPLYLYGFGNYTNTEYDSFSKMYFNYREWSPVHATSCSLCETVSALDTIIGPLDVDNPLKWAVYKALTNSNGASVGYVSVKDPSDLDDWQDAISILEGRTDVYTVVPLSTDLAVQNLVVTLVNNESSAESCRWKTALFNMELPTEVMRIGASSSTQVKTSTDGKLVKAKIVANPLLTSGAINKVVCTSGNSKFIDYGVVPGDELRIVNGSGSVARSYTVDQIYSNGTLTIVESLTTPSTEDVIEIWHTYTKSEEVELIRDRAQSFASRRIGLVWPDIVAEGAVEMPGYYLSAALAGLKSGVEPQNGLTRRTIQGFDSFTRSKPRYTESQLDLMAGSGVWVCVEDSDGTPQSRHALNTDTTNTFYSEEMMTRNFDSISKYMYQVIDAYIGTSNVTEETLLAIYYNIRKACDYLIGKGQMINYTTITVKQHDLLLDRVVAYLNVGLPFAVNNVELYITAEAYELNTITLESEAE